MYKEKLIAFFSILVKEKSLEFFSLSLFACLLKKNKRVKEKNFSKKKGKNFGKKNRVIFWKN